LAALLIKTLQEQDEFDCGCENTVSFFHPPEE
jgi:hypothetical protein